MGDHLGRDAVMDDESRNHVQKLVHFNLELCIQVSYAFFLATCMIARQIGSKTFKKLADSF